MAMKCGAKVKFEAFHCMVIVTFPEEWKILALDIKQKINKRTENIELMKTCLLM